MIEYLLFSAGLLFWLIVYIVRNNYRVNKFILFFTVISLFIQFISFNHIFLGPVGDSQGYITRISGCFGNFGLCGSRLHEHLWGIPATILGPLWACIYGFILGRFIYAVKDFCLEYSQVDKFLFVFCLSYSIYQISNGMAEFTYSALILYLTITIFSNNTIKANIKGFILPVLITMGHLGNAFIFSVYIRKLKHVFALVFLLLIPLLLFPDLIVNLVNKAAALQSTEMVNAAIETKIDASIRKADTSYGDVLIFYGFPNTTSSLFLSVLLYLFPVFVVFYQPVNAVGLLVMVFSSLMSISILRLQFKLKGIYFLVGLLSVFISTILFSISSFTPGIGLRHKVPLFIFLLSVCYYTNGKRS